MSVALLREPPLALPRELGPYRRPDYEDLPGEPRCELIHGRFYLSPSPSPLHQVVAFRLGRLLDDVASASGGLLLLAPIDVVLAEHSVVQPDVIYLSAARRGIVGERIEGAPDLLVEVLSPGTARRDRDEKLALYAESGVREYWIVDPRELQVEFLINEGGRFVVALPVGGEYRSRVLPEIHLDLPSFWGAVGSTLPGSADRSPASPRQ
jgi:Uma2 family endonuclease